MERDAHSPTAPAPRGPISEALLEALLRGRPLPVPPAAGGGALHPPADDPLGDEDLQLALTCCYELHYRGLAGVDDRWEWDSGLLAWRGHLERRVEADLRRRCAGPPCGPDEVTAGLWDLVRTAEGPSLSAHLAARGTLPQLREFLVHRSAYQLKEADPHTWGIPRLWGAPKAALVEIQADEYGNGHLPQVHAELFASTLRAVGLDDRYGAHLDRLPAATLATVNLVTMFGLHRRLRGALVGHLAVFEMTSVEPMGRYAEALRRHGFGPDATGFYDAHVVADETHQHVAAERMAGGLARQQPALTDEILFGARAVLAVERRFAESLLGAWAEGRSSLRTPNTGVPTGAALAAA
jgi:hypothetical protein